LHARPPCRASLCGGPHGARLSPAQKDLLAGRFSSVVLPDGDQTGRAATAQIAGDLAPACSVKNVLLPPEMQPDHVAEADIHKALAEGEVRHEIAANQPI